MGSIEWAILVGAVAMAANVIHWRFRRSERFLCPPHSNKVIAIGLIVALAMFVFAVLFKFNVLPAEPMIFTVAGLVVGHETYSLWLRHQWRISGLAVANSNLAIEAIGDSPTARFDYWAAYSLVRNQKPIKSSRKWPFQSTQVRQIFEHAIPAELTHFHVEAM